MAECVIAVGAVPFWVFVKGEASGVRSEE